MSGLLCVGGPYDGRRVETRNGHPRFVAPEKTAIGEARWRQVIYVLREFSDEGRRTYIWAPSDQTMDQTIQMLLQAYEESKKPCPPSSST